MKKIKLIKTSFMQSQHYQTGAVLFVCLIFTMMITLLAVTAIRTSTLTERIAANSRDKSLAFQAAETALRDAESFLKSASGATATFNDSHGLYDSTDGTELQAVARVTVIPAL